MTNEKEALLAKEDQDLPLAQQGVGSSVSPQKSALDDAIDKMLGLGKYGPSAPDTSFGQSTGQKNR